MRLQQRLVFLVLCVVAITAYWYTATTTPSPPSSHEAPLLASKQASPSVFSSAPLTAPVAIGAPIETTSLQTWLQQAGVHRHAVPLVTFLSMHNARQTSTAPQTGLLQSDPDALRGRYVVLFADGESRSDTVDTLAGLSANASLHLPRHRGRRATSPLATILSTAGLVRAEDIHLIDRHHRLIYLDPARLARGVSKDADGILTPLSIGHWRVVDAFAAHADAPLLKLSAELRQAMRELCNRSLALDTARAITRLDVTVWTAYAAADDVMHDLQNSPYPGSRAGPPCTLLTQRAAADTPGLLLVQLRGPTANAADPRRAHPSASLSCACVLTLRRIASHPAVRWVETTVRRAWTLNEVAAATVQGGCHNASTQDGRAHDVTQLTHPLWSIGVNGSGEIVNVADSGVDMGSCFFYDTAHPVRYYPSLSSTHRKLVSYHPCDLAGDAPDFTDVAHGHGTHVAGSAVGAAPANTPLARGNGVAPGARLFVRDLGCTGVRDLVLPRYIGDVFAPGYGAGARIGANAWGFPAPTASGYSGVERQIDAYAAAHDDLLLIFAAGNAPSLGVYTPGTAKNVLTVGAHLNLLPEEQQNSLATSSAYGPVFDGRQKPELVAPGGYRVNSADALGSDDPHRAAPFPTPMHCGLAQKMGTSMATGVLAGTAALLRQYLREHSVDSTPPSAALLKAALAHSTVFLRPPRQPTVRSGYGRVDLSLLLAPEASPSSSPLPPSRSWWRDRVVLQDRASDMFCFSADARAAVVLPAITEVNSASELRMLKVTLSWTDPAAAAEGSARSLVNDLDLVVVDAMGKVYYGNEHLLSASAEAGWGDTRYDRVNNMEQVRLPLNAALARSFRVMVYGESIRGSLDGLQSYALVVSAPGLVFEEDCMRALSGREDVFCANNCSAHGSCAATTAKQCVCTSRFRGIDCGLCDDAVVCHGRGECDATTLQCRCAAGSHFADASCSVCAKGWYGPHCDSDCMCQNGGECHAKSGQCRCVRDNTYGGHGCFDGARCEYCCPGYGGPRCNERSYWCDTSGAVVSVTAGWSGYIEVNGYDQYPRSVTCTWRVIAPPGHRIALNYISYDIVENYNALNLYEPRADDDATELLVRSDAGVLRAPFTHDSKRNTLRLVFFSDWGDVARGFLLRYRFVSSSACRVQCVAPGTEVPASRLRCGEALGLPDWCVCQPPYMGWHCAVDSKAEGVGKSRPAPPPHSFFVAETQMMLSVTDSSPPSRNTSESDATRAASDGGGGGEGSSGAAAVKDEGQGEMARVVLTVNGYTRVRLHVLSAGASPVHGTARGSLPDAVQVSLLLPTSHSIDELSRLTLVVALIGRLDDRLERSIFVQTRLLALQNCLVSTANTAPVVTLLIPLLATEGGASIPAGAPMHDSVTATTELIMSLLWNASLPVSVDLDTRRDTMSAVMRWDGSLTGLSSAALKIHCGAVQEDAHRVFSGEPEMDPLMAFMPPPPDLRPSRRSSGFFTRGRVALLLPLSVLLGILCGVLLVRHLVLPHSTATTMLLDDTLQPEVEMQSVAIPYV